MKIFASTLLLSALVAPSLGLAIDRQALEERNNYRQPSGKVIQDANSGNWVDSSNNGGKAKNGDTSASSGRKGYAIAVPIAKAGGGDTDVTSGKASNSNKNSGDRSQKVDQYANSGNEVWSSNNGGKASNGDTNAWAGKKGTAAAIPIAYAEGGDTTVTSGDASNTNEKRNDWGEQKHRQGSVKQSANSGNWVDSSNNGGKAKNGDTSASSGRKGYAIAVPIAKAGGGDTDVTSGKASNSNKNSGDRSQKVDQYANSGNEVWSSNNGGKASNGDTNAWAGKKGTAAAIPIAYAEGGDTTVTSGDASNTNEKRNNWGEQKHRQGSVKQSANSGNTVYSYNNGGRAKNGDTDSDGLIAVAVPVAIGQGGTTDTKSGKATNSNKNSSGKKSGNVKQDANSGNYVESSGNGGHASNGDTDSDGGLIGVAVPIAVAGGGDTTTSSGDASNSNE